MIARSRSRVARAGAIGALAGVALAAAAAAASAQPYDEGPAVGQVTVYGPHRYAYEPETGARVRMDSVSRVVSLGDLDLATRFGAYEARRRIDAAARNVCNEATDVYMWDGEPPGGCYQRAVHDAVAQVEDVVGYPIFGWQR